ncbi:hypothetical protein EfmJHP35_23930 [Enterococcus faecium]|nr:hypothetical protein EfmJHP35_23930 [Enterococcus faecium]
MLHFCKKYRDGQEIIYTVTEDNVPEYSTTIDGYNIKNSYTPEKTNISIPGSHITPWKIVKRLEMSGGGIEERIFER